MNKDIEKKVDNLFAIKHLEKFDTSEKRDYLINPSEGIPWYGKAIILILILTVVCSVVFYVITPSEAFTYYMAEGLKAASGIALYFIKTFGIAAVLVMIALSMKPILPTFEYQSIYEDVPQKYYYYPNSYKIIQGIGVIKTVRGKTINFLQSNTLKKGNKVYQITPVIEDIDADGIMILDTTEKEVQAMKFLTSDNKNLKIRCDKLHKELSLVASQDTSIYEIRHGNSSKKWD